MGFTITSTAEEAGLLRKWPLATGDMQIISKLLGTGTLLATDMRRKAKAQWIDSALDSMLLSTIAAARHSPSIATRQRYASAIDTKFGHALLKRSMQELIR